MTTRPYIVESLNGELSAEQLHAISQYCLQQGIAINIFNHHVLLAVPSNDVNKTLNRFNNKTFQTRAFTGETKLMKVCPISLCQKSHSPNHSWVHSLRHYIRQSTHYINASINGCRKGCALGHDSNLHIISSHNLLRVRLGQKNIYPNPDSKIIEFEVEKQNILSFVRSFYQFYLKHKKNSESICVFLERFGSTKIERQLEPYCEDVIEFKSSEDDFMQQAEEVESQKEVYSEGTNDETLDLKHPSPLIQEHLLVTEINKPAALNEKTYIKRDKESDLEKKVLDLKKKLSIIQTKQISKQTQAIDAHENKIKKNVQLKTQDDHIRLSKDSAVKSIQEIERIEIDPDVPEIKIKKTHSGGDQIFVDPQKTKPQSNTILSIDINENSTASLFFSDTTRLKINLFNLPDQVSKKTVVSDIVLEVIKDQNMCTIKYGNQSTDINLFTNIENIA